MNKVGGENTGESDTSPNNKADGHTDIDFINISQRILALPMPARNYVSLKPGKKGILYILEDSPAGAEYLFSGGQTLHKYDITARKAEKILDGISDLVVSANGEKLLCKQGDQWMIASTMGPIESSKKFLRTGEMEVLVEPLAEWKQMYHEVWRTERDFFYDAGYHGLDLQETEKRYAPYLDGIVSRADLNYLFEEMLGELTCGHIYIERGDQPQAEIVQCGLLGADYIIENGHYRFSHIYDGENWNPELRAPLTQPGSNIAVGEYLLAVNDQELSGDDEIYSLFEKTAGKSVTIRVGPNHDGTNSREVIVVPVESEYRLRNLSWIEGNRRMVDELSGGRLAYVYMRDTDVRGYKDFNRYYFSQVGKEGAVIDERYNGGGWIADYIIDNLKRPLMGYFTAREGADYSTPICSIYGPKAMIINEYAGSGGDMMPWLFRAAGIGPLVGKRTWGGLVGMADALTLMDGGIASAPQSGFWNPNGTWDIENHGVDPDYEIEMEPASVCAGHDPQLEKTVKLLLEELEKNPLPKHKKPSYPNYHRKP